VASSQGNAPYCKLGDKIVDLLADDSVGTGGCSVEIRNSIIDFLYLPPRLGGKFDFCFSWPPWRLGGSIVLAVESLCASVVNCS
jgi:hypothetical protein